jgi:hypothetical protein
MSDQPNPAIEGWAHGHGFEPTGERIEGATPLLRLGDLDTTDDSYRGTIAGSEAILAEFSVGSPGVTQAFGGGGIDSTGFTLFLVGVDASDWPRLTVHPSGFSDHDWVKRLLHIDRRVATISPDMDAHYRVIASVDIPDSRLREFFSQQLIEWWLAQEQELVVDIEDHPPSGGYLTVAHLGIGLGASQLTTLHEQTEQILGALALPDSPG